MLLGTPSCLFGGDMGIMGKLINFLETYQHKYIAELNGMLWVKALIFESLECGDWAETIFVHDWFPKITFLE